MVRTPQLEKQILEIVGDNTATNTRLVQIIMFLIILYRGYSKNIYYAHNHIQMVQAHLQTNFEPQ